MARFTTPKNGKVHDTEYHLLFTIANGRVQTVREYSDLSRAADLFGDGKAG